MSTVTDVRRPSADHGEPPSEVVPPRVVLPTAVVIWSGLALWVVALAVLLLVPDLRSGERSWWLWVPVAGLSVGALGALYLLRGRGNAADAHLRKHSPPPK